MRRTTLLTAAAVTLVSAGAGVGSALLVERREAPVDTSQWPVEELVADPEVSLPYPLHLTLAGCPGFSLSSPVPDDGRHAPAATSYTVTFDPDHLALWVCLGPVDEGARRAVADHLGATEVGDTGATVWNVNPSRVQAPFGEMYRVDRVFAEGTSPRLTDWLVDHEGYTYAFGYLHPVDDVPDVDVVEAMIASITFDEPG
ncbi:hypothetical protein Cch01nite_34230 [Cellulomonas chitinilytica]|uniref:Uncharacterized protein n=1 Tax=Cellulomonas chitinilytica TaxID=398759 RepID=A0A919P7H6_9CELL|nr:hypothetical protein [Cellulomonas chitinilytica]GIG22699.1 hypothetical protein Cch01nite_34230 [Cellulomonas chitinilytica]